jgi:CubicO group peptidase (beta-lactamase class C family)
MVQRWSSQPLVTTPGAAFAYLNMGYVIAGAMLERVADTSWEKLIVGRVFDPLGLRSAGSALNQPSARWMHRWGTFFRPGGTPRPMLAGPFGDNLAVIGRAATVHLSILDFGTWAAWQVGAGLAWCARKHYASNTPGS